MVSRDSSTATTGHATEELKGQSSSRSRATREEVEEKEEKVEDEDDEEEEEDVDVDVDDDVDARQATQQSEKKTNKALILIRDFS